MAHGVTRRVQRLIEQGLVSADVVRAAHHEADLHSHAYVGLEHVELARLALAGRVSELHVARRGIRPDMQRGRWRPLGRTSALRVAGIRDTQRRRQEAEKRERKGYPLAEG